MTANRNLNPKRPRSRAHQGVLPPAMRQMQPRVVWIRHHRRSVERGWMFSYWLSSFSSTHQVCAADRGFLFLYLRTSFCWWRTSSFFVQSFPSSPDRWALWGGAILESGWKFICNYWIRGDAHFVVIAGGSHDIRIIDIVSLRQWRSPICELISRWIYLSMMWSLDLTSCHDCWILDRGSVWWSMGSTCGISRYVFLGYLSMDYVFYNPLTI